MSTMLDGAWFLHFKLILQCLSIPNTYGLVFEALQGSIGKPGSKLRTTLEREGEEIHLMHLVHHLVDFSRMLRG